jgi:hypothetical protein
VPTPTPTPPPNSNYVFPIALNQALVNGRANNTSLGTITSGSGAANFAWLTWTGNTAESVLQASLVWPGNSSTYSNPAAPGDQHIDVGDPISGFTDISNNSNNKGAIDNLAGRDLIVPLFSSFLNNRFTVSGFALINVSVSSNGFSGSTDEMTITFLRRCDSAGN